jgi:hypothetical protein
MTEGTSQRVPMSQRGVETLSKKVVIPPKDPEFKIRPSLLSTEASSHSYRGFLNLTVILLVCI